MFRPSCPLMTVLIHGLHTSVLLFSVLGAAAFASAGEFRSRNEFDLGTTDNAYLTKDARKSDTFMLAGTSNYWQRDAHELQLRLSYKDYFVENPNDVFGWKVGDRFKSGDWSFTGALLGQQYTAGSPGTTDNSYDNIGLDFRAEREEDWGADLTAIQAGGFRVRDYTSFGGGRIDNNPFAGFVLERKIGESLHLSGVSEAGIVLSNLPDYSRLYYELSGLVDYDLGARWSWTGDLTIGQSYFLNRTISTPIDRLNRRGIRVAGSATSREAYSDIFLSTGAVRRQSGNFRWGGEVSSSSQSSRSGWQDYSALTFMGQGILIF